MEVEDLTTLSAAVVTAIGVIGGFIARDRYLASTIANGDKSVRDEMHKNIDTCHERINKTRDEFVRRDDLDGHLTRIERTVAGMHDEVRGTNRRIDEFMTAVSHDKRKDT